MAREIGLYLIAIVAFSSLSVAIASSDLPQDFLVSPLVALLLLSSHPVLLWIVARTAGAAGSGWRI